MSGGNIVLIGMTGGGKTTVGRILARRLRRAFVDSDERVEEMAGESVARIFARGGEAAFRRFEAAALGEILRARGQVVACGGGAVLRASNRALMRRAGAVVHLRANAETLARRLARNRRGRPLLPAAAGGALTDALAAMERTRAPLYERTAKIAVCADAPPEEVARRVQKSLAAADLS